MRLTLTALSLIVCLGFVTATTTWADDENAEAESKPIEPAAVELGRAVDFEQDIYPILEANCIACHNLAIDESDLVLEDVESALKGGARGVAVVPEDPEKSLLYKVAARIEEPHMPPLPNEMEAEALTAEQLGLLRQWIVEGATAGAGAGGGMIDWQPLPDELNAIYSVALSPQGRLVASGRSNQVDIFDVVTGEQLTRLVDPHLTPLEHDGRPMYPGGAAHRDFVHSLAFSPDGTLLASGGYRVIKLWQKPKDVQLHHMPVEQPVTSVAVSADGKRAAIAAADNTIRIWNLTDGTAGGTLSGHTAGVTSLEFWPTKRQMAEHRQTLDAAQKAEQVAAIQAAQAREQSETAARNLQRRPDDEALKTAQQEAAKALEAAEAALSTAKTQVQQSTDALAAFENQVADSSKLLSSSSDKTIRLWNPADGAQIAATETPAPVNDAAFNVDATQVFTAGGDNIVRVWPTPSAENAEAAAPIAELAGHGGPVKSVALVLPKGEQLVTGSEDGTLRIWNLADGKQVHAIEHGGPVTDVDVRPDGAVIASAGGTFAKLWQLADGKQVAELKGSQQANTLVTQRTDAQTVAKQRVGLADAGVKNAEKNVQDREESAKKAQEEKEAADKALAEAQAKLKTDEEALAAAKTELEGKPEDEAAKKKVTDAEAALTAQKETIQKATEAQASAVRGIELAAKAIEIVKAELEQAKTEKAVADQRQQQADAELAEAQQAAAETVKPVQSVCFSADGKKIVTAGDNGLLQLYAASNGTPLETFAGHQGPVTAVDFGPADTIVSGSHDQTAVAWDANPAWQLIGQLGPGNDAPLDLSPSPFAERVLCLDFSPDGTLLAAGGGEPSRSGELMIWNVAEQSLVENFTDAHSDTVLGVEFSRDGKYLASGAADKFVKVFDVATAEHVRSFEGHTHHVLDVSWKADGSWLASAGADNAIKIWNFETGEQVRTISNYAKQVTSLHFIGTGENLVSSGGDKTVRLHKSSNGQNFRNFGGATDFVYAAAATRDESLVVAGGEDGRLRVWNGANAESVQTFEPPAAPAGAP